MLCMRSPGRLPALHLISHQLPPRRVQASTVQAICATAYNQLLAAQQHGAHEHVVALATTLFQLLPLADQHLRVEATGAAQQARVLMLAQQALLDLHAVQSEG